MILHVNYLKENLHAVLSMLSNVECIDLYGSENQQYFILRVFEMILQIWDSSMFPNNDLLRLHDTGTGLLLSVVGNICIRNL